MEEVRSFWSRWLPSLHVAKRMSALLGVVLLYSVVVAVIVHATGYPKWHAGTEWTAINGLVLGTLLVFRNKEAYDRWWEGRKLWGQLINETRNLALKVKSFVDPSPEEFRRFMKLLVAFPYALKCHLRDDEDLHHVPGFEQDPGSTTHLPLHIANLIFEMLARWNREKELKEINWMLDGHARALLDICGACERISKSPVPASYRALLRHGIALYLILAPWSMILENGFWGVPILAVAFYFLLGIEMTAEDVEEPFGTDPDDLPLEKLCETIRVSVEEIEKMSGLGDSFRTQVPKELNVKV